MLKARMNSAAAGGLSSDVAAFFVDLGAARTLNFRLRSKSQAYEVITRYNGRKYRAPGTHARSPDGRPPRERPARGGHRMLTSSSISARRGRSISDCARRARPTR
jgi:hypothetical protein